MFSFAEFLASLITFVIEYLTAWALSALFPEEEGEE